MKYLSQLRPNQLRNKICLLRVDLNIESPEKDTFRLQAILPTIKFLIKNRAKVVILSHRGRPEIKSKIKNQKSKFLKKFSLKPFAKILSRLLKKPVHFVDFNIGKSDLPKLSSMLRRSDFQKLKGKIKILSAGSIFLLENLRFFPEEEKNEKQFAKKLASLGDIYINDAFAVSHRENASVAAITQFLPSYAGLLLEKEIKNLDSVMAEFKKPLIIILGGAKVSDKVGLINNFLGKADYFLIGGAMANTFFASQGLPVGDSLYEKDADLPLTLFSQKGEGRKIILPIDVVVWKRKILDIGPETIKKYAKIIKKAKTIIWNGPMGMFEDKRFAEGTKEITRAIRSASRRMADKKAKIVIGGGETIASLKIKNQISKIKKNVFLSTGGGAMLEYLAGKKLPGIQALEK